MSNKRTGKPAGHDGFTDFIPLAKARELFPKVNGKHPAVRTLGRWGLTGLRGVRLELTKIGGRWFTTVEAIETFIRQTNGEREFSRIPRRSKREMDRYKRILKSRGYGDAGSKKHLLKLLEEDDEVRRKE